MAKIGPYSRPSSMGGIDGRSAEGRFLRRVRAELTQHVGGSPDAAQKMLIDRIAMLRLRLHAMEALKPSREIMDDLASRTYLAWSGHLGRLLRELGPAVPLPAATKDLRSVLARPRPDVAA